MKIILGSKSPRRQELLKQIGVEYQCIVSEKEEIVTSNLPEQVVLELSRMKASDVDDQIVQAGLAKEEEVLIIAADTIVAYKDTILGKPKNETDAFYTLKQLQGTSHQVYTGVSIILRKGDRKKEIVFAECTHVFVKPMTDAMIHSYIATNESMDKAGSYAIQGFFAVNIEKIEGDYNNVVGLPIARIYTEVLSQLGIDILSGRHVTKACIFDLDGTTLDTVESIATTANQALQKFGFVPHPQEQYKIFAGDGQIELIKRALKAAGDEKLASFDAVMQEYIQLFKTGCMYHVKPYDGIRELLKALKKQGILIAILSNKAHQNTCAAVEELFGKGYFDYILGQKPEYERKPSAEGVQIILEELGVEADDCLYIGDTSTDMQTGKNASMYTVGVTWGFRDETELITHGADAIIHTPMELLDILK